MSVHDPTSSATNSATDSARTELDLARACAAGDRVAMQAFETALFGEVRACHARIRPSGLTLDELEQRVRAKLFASNAIASFAGKGDLRRWLRVLTARLIFDHLRARRPEVPFEDQIVGDLLDRSADASLAKAELRSEIRIALREAFGALTDRQKLLLHGEVRGTPLAALAATYQVHVRSMQRWVREAHEAFVAAFRRRLAERLRVAPRDLSSLLAFARSQLLSGLGALAEDTPPSAVQRT